MVVGFIVETFYKGALEIGLMLGVVTLLEKDEFQLVELVELLVLVVVIIGGTTTGSKEPSSTTLIGLV